MKTFIVDKNSSGSALRFAAVVPSDVDGTDFTVDGEKAFARGLWVGVKGDVAIVGERGGAPVVFKNVEGELRVVCRRVAVTGTTATNIVALF